MASASEMPSKDQTKDLKNLLECSICLETFDDPRTLSCLHSFCRKCLETFVDGKPQNELNCPVCRTNFTLSKDGVAGMTRNHFICNMVDVLSIQHQDKCIPCMHCEQQSVGRCVTCEHFMCEKCLKAHNEFLGFKDHVVLTMEELAKPENQSRIKKISKCDQHPNKKLKYYCETCDQLMCRHCIDFEHDKQHKFSPLEKAAKSKREGLKKVLVESARREIQTLCSLERNREFLNCKFETEQGMMNIRKNELLRQVEDRLQSRVDIIMGDARRNFEDIASVLDERIKRQETVLNRMTASAGIARSLFENGNDEEIVRVYNSIKENLDKEENFTSLSSGNLKIDTRILRLSSGDIQKLLLLEIKGVVEEELGRIKAK